MSYHNSYSSLGIRKSNHFGIWHNFIWFINLREYHGKSEFWKNAVQCGNMLENIGKRWTNYGNPWASAVNKWFSVCSLNVVSRCSNFLWYSFFDLTIEVECCSPFSSSFVDWWSRLLHLSVSDALKTGAGVSYENCIWLWLESTRAVQLSSSGAFHRSSLGGLKCVSVQLQHRWTGYTAQCTMHSVQCTVYTAQCTVHSVHNTQSSDQTALCTRLCNRLSKTALDCAHCTQSFKQTTQCTMYIRLTCTMHIS